MNRIIQCNRSRSIRLIVASAALGLAAGASQAASLLAVNAPSLSFVPSSLVAGQSARVSLVNLAPVNSNRIPPDPVRACRVSVNFYNANGDAVGEAQSFDLMPGQSALAAAPAAILLPPPTNLGGAQLAQVRADVQLVPQSGRVLPPDPCRALHAGYEVFDTRTQQTQLMNPGVIHGFNPQPDPPG